MIQVVNIKKGASYDVYIGRANRWLNLDGSKWQNPFVMKNEGVREEVLKQYEDYIRQRPHLLNALKELDGKVLGCYCAPKKCHGDILKKLFDEFVK